MLLAIPTDTRTLDKLSSLMYVRFTAPYIHFPAPYTAPAQPHSLPSHDTPGSLGPLPAANVVPDTVAEIAAVLVPAPVYSSVGIANSPPT